MTPIEEVYDYFLSLLEDRGLGNLAKDDFDYLLSIWLKHAIPKFDNCKKSLLIKEIKEEKEIQEDEEVKKVEETKLFIEGDLNYEEISILAQAMLLVCTQKRLHREQLTEQQFGTKDFSKLSNANILLRLKDTYELDLKEFKLQKRAYAMKSFKGN